MADLRITAPFTAAEDVKKFKKAGAGELYCGFTDKTSERSWPAAFHVINHRGGGGSFTDPGAIREALAEARREKLPVFVTFNSFYTKEQYPWVLAAVEKVSGMRGCAGIITADIALMLTLRRMGYDKDICVSTGGTAFNARTVEFFSSLGASRVILDRQLSGAEIAAIAERCEGKIDLEIFVFHGGCMFVDGYCMFFHCKDDGERTALGPGAELVSRYYVPSENHGGCSKLDEILGQKTSHEKDKYPYGCNLCALHGLKGRLLTLKVVGRGEDRLETVRQIAELVRRADALSRARYVREAKKVFSALSGRTCNGFRCYFPPPLSGSAS